jgi:cardiolipin synthase
VHTAFIVLGGLALGIQSLLLFLAFFGPDLPYRVVEETEPEVESEKFLSLLAVLTDAQVRTNNSVQVLSSGDCFYPAQLEAIRQAERSINLEAYIFHRGEVADQFVAALTERARAGVAVKLTIDFIGSLSTRKSYFRDLIAAGGRVGWYHSLRLDLLPQINNRTHREILVVDGRVAFVGGAGVADWWYEDRPGHPRWRDTVVRVEGPLVTNIQSVFVHNWLRVEGEILTGERYFKSPPDAGDSTGMVVHSTPSAGSTRARTLFQMLISGARRRIWVNTPYFLPDLSARRAIIEATRDRHIEVKIITPGRRSDHSFTRNSSRALYGPLLKNGVEIYEYQASMIHTKALMVDDCWSVVGSTNFDHRSFELNDEINLAFMDSAITRRLMADFERDLRQSTQVTYEQWRRSTRFNISEMVEALLTKQE